MIIQTLVIVGNNKISLLNQIKVERNVLNKVLNKWKIIVSNVSDVWMEIR